MRKALTCILLTLFLVMEAQPPLRFYSTFGGDGEDIAYSGKPTLDGHYIVAGSSSSYGTHGHTDVYLVKVDSMGWPMWYKFHGGSGNDVGKSVIQLADSGYMVAGFTSSYGEGGYDAYLIRTDKQGELIWERTFGGADWDFASDLVQAADGSVFMVGYTSSAGHGKKDGFVVKYDLSGQELFHRFIGGSENDELRSVISTKDGMLAMVGYTESRGDINGDGYFVKLDLNGDTVFTSLFGGPYKDYATDLVQKSNGDYFLCGAKTFSLNESARSYMFSMDSVGNFIADNHFYASSGGDDEHWESLTNSQQLPHLTAYLRNIPVFALKQQGNLWLAGPSGWNYKVNSFGGYEDEECFSIEGTKDGGFLVVGSTLSYNTLGKDVFFMKHDSTCYNYQSIVGLKEEVVQSSFVAHLQEKQYRFRFGEARGIPERMVLSDLSGREVWSLSPSETTFDQDFYGLPPAVYLLRLRYKDGNTAYHKLMIR
jgi:hypothetical protein